MSKNQVFSCEIWLHLGFGYTWEIIGDDRKILTFSWLDELEVLEHFIRGFYKWELIHETGVINSGVKSLFKCKTCRNMTRIAHELYIFLDKLVFKCKM